MIDLFDNETDRLLGRITQEQLRLLIDNLEETDASDRDYYLDVATLDLLEDEGADAELIQLLRNSLGDREGIDIRWAEAEG